MVEPGGWRRCTGREPRPVDTAGKGGRVVRVGLAHPVRTVEPAKITFMAPERHKDTAWRTVATPRRAAGSVAAYLVLCAPFTALVVGDAAPMTELLTGAAPATAVGADQVVRAVPVTAASIPRGLALLRATFRLLDPAATVAARRAPAALESTVGEAPAATWTAHGGPRLRRLRTGNPGEQPRYDST